jgi:GT2 family glycosyltransferase
MSFRRDALERAGGFEIGRVGMRPLGCDDTDFCIRASQPIPNGKIVYDPSVKVVHHVPNHRARWKYFRARCYTEGLANASPIASALARVTRPSAATLSVSCHAPSSVASTMR